MKTETEERVANLNRVRVPKEKLLEKLCTNRDSHKIEFKEALEGYFDALSSEINEILNHAVASMERNIARAKEQDPLTRTHWPARSVDVRKPIDHTHDFERAIAQLEWEMAETVDLTSQEFDRYVLNKWEWLKDHITSVGSFAPRHLGNYNQ